VKGFDDSLAIQLSGYFAAAAEAMRRVLVDHVRRRTRLKRGGGQLRINIDDMDLAGASPDE
jgi:hypothetical protein